MRNENTDPFEIEKEIDAKSLGLDKGILESFDKNEKLVMLLPTNRQDAPFFQGTIEYYRYLKEVMPGFDVELDSKKEDYYEIALYSNWLRLATTVIFRSALDLFLGILSDYIKKKNKENLEDVKVQCEIFVVNDDQSIRRINYKGPSSSFDKLVETFNKND